MRNLLKKTVAIFMAVTFMTCTVGGALDNVIYADEFDGDVSENPFAHLFQDDSKREPVIIDDEDEQKIENTNTAPKEKAANKNLKKALKTSIRSATKQKKKARKARIVLKKIKKVKGVRYQIKYASNKKMKKPKVKTYKKVRITLKKLKPKKRYYVKARAYARNNSGRKIYGKWTKRRQIQVTKKK